LKRRLINIEEFDDEWNTQVNTTQSSSRMFKNKGKKKFSVQATLNQLYIKKTLALKLLNFSTRVKNLAFVKM